MNQFVMGFSFSTILYKIADPAPGDDILYWVGVLVVAITCEIIFRLHKKPANLG